MVRLVRKAGAMQPARSLIFLSAAAFVMLACSVQPALAATTTPHAVYLETTDLCSFCHDPHDAETAQFLFSARAGGTGELGVCYSCHGGVGADGNVRDGASNSFALASGHQVENVGVGADLTNTCSSCHTPHKDPTALRGLPAATVNSVEVGAPGNGWCFACHDDAQAWYTVNQGWGAYPQLSNPTKDSTGYPIFGTFPGPSIYTSGTLNAHERIPSSAGATTRVAGDCLYCHVSHRSNSAYDSLVATFQPSTSATVYRDRVYGDYAAACFECHDGTRFTPAAVNIKQYATYNGASADALSGHRVKSADATLPVNSPLPCYECHNPHGSSRGNGHLISDALGASLDTTGATGVRRFCFTCHSSSDGALGWDSTVGNYTAVGSTAKVVGLRRDGGLDNSGPGGSGKNWLWLKAVSGHASTDDQSCYDCHGNTYGDDPAASNNVHNPSPGLSSGGTKCYACHSAYKNPMEDGSGDTTGATRADFYHHVMGGHVTGTVTYQEGDYAPGPTGAYPTSSTAGIFCVSCHLDHDAFNSNKAANLRSQSLGVEPTSTDLALCMSCHDSSNKKDTAGDSHSDGTTMTVPVWSDFYASAHQYEVTSTFSGGTTFRADCSKCHGGESPQPKSYMTGGPFGVHWSPSRRLLSALGGTASDPLGSGFCYRCHSRADDPLAGTKKPKDGRDWYGDKGASIRPADEYVWRAFNDASIVSTHPVDRKLICENCHSPHAVSETFPVANPKGTDLRAPWTTQLDRATFCLGCHDGAPPVYVNDDYTGYVPATVTIDTLGDLANKNTYAATAHWAEWGSINAGELVACGDCHDNHGSQLPKLLGQYDGANATNTINGAGLGGNDNSVCYACHGPASTSSAAPVRDLTGYIADGSWPGSSTYTLGYNALAHTGNIHESATWPVSASGWGGGDCKNCHDVHGTANEYDELRTETTQSAQGVYRYSSTTFGFCFNCHDSDGSSQDNIAQYYPIEASGTAVQTESSRFGHRTRSLGNLPAGSALPCYDCHNPHGSSAAYGLLVVTETSPGHTEVIGDASNEISMTPNTDPAHAADHAIEVRSFCFSCHTTSNEGSATITKGWNGSAMETVTAGALFEGISRTTYAFDGAHLKLPDVSGHRDHDTSNCYTCHGNAYTPGGQNVHNPSPGLSEGGQTCYGCHSAYKVMDAKDASTSASYHHVMGTSTVSYTGDSAPATGTYPTSKTDVFCVSCHTDHNYFNNNKAGNLRSGITNASGAATLATDFLPGTGLSTTEAVTASYYANATSDTANTWLSDAASIGATDGASAYSTTPTVFQMWQSFGTFPTDWTRITAATINVVSQARPDGWGRTAVLHSPGNGTRIDRPYGPDSAGLVSGTWATVPTGNTRSGVTSETVADATTYATLQGTSNQTITGYSLFPTVTANAIPADATNISVGVRHYSAKSGGTTASTAQPTLMVGGSTYTSGTLTLTTAFQSHGATWTLNPRTVQPWTAAEINGSGQDSLGYYGVTGSIGSGGTARYYWLSQAYLVVTYYDPGTLTNDDQWAIDYSTNSGSLWTSIFAANSTSETTLTNHTAPVTVGASALETNTASSFRVRIRGIQVNTWDASGTIGWDGSRLDLVYTRSVPPNNGICVSCHSVALPKQRQGIDQASLGASNTPAISIPDFSGSSHSYNATSTYGDGTVFYANCSKCHSDEQTKEFQSGDHKFGTHWSASVGILRALGAFVHEEPKEESCFKCHRAAGDVYGATMSAVATSVETSFALLSKHPLDKVTCANCHNVHEATEATPVVDPNNTYNAYAYSLTNTATVNGFCLNCHDGTTPSQAVTGSVLVPYTVSANATANVSVFYSSDGHGKTTGANVDCRECHDKHGSTLVHLLKKSVNSTSVPAYSDTVDEAQCLACHRAGGMASSANIAQYYPTSAYGSAAASMTRSGHRTETSATLAAGSALPCRLCHNPHGGGTGGFMLSVRTQINSTEETMVGDTSGELTMTVAGQATPANVRNFCLTCHITSDAIGEGWNGSALVDITSGKVLGIDRTGGVLKLPSASGKYFGHAAADTGWSCYVCHGDDFTTATSVNVHNPAAGESAGKIACYVCHSVYQYKMEDGQGSKIGADRTSSYHHVLGGNLRSGVPADGDTTSYPNVTDTGRDTVFCLSCHVDHDYFSPFAAAGKTRAANLRLQYGAGTPSQSDATNTDFTMVTGGTNGVCLGCHSTALQRDNANQKAETASSWLPTITATTYDPSAHDYTATSTFSDNSTFYANCTKCHDSEIDGGGMEEGTKTAGFQRTPGNQFSVHYSAARRILGAMGVTIYEPPHEEDECYSCHVVRVGSKDYYGVRSMSATSQALSSLMTSAYAHHVVEYEGIHLPSSQDETRGYISRNKHVECTDCHDVHEAQASRHTTGTNLVSGSLYGVSGARVTTSASNWTSPTAYALVATATTEYQICFKCHSGFNQSTEASGQATLITWGGSGAQAWTDQGLEFSTSNQSYHPVLAALPPTDPGAAGSSQLSQAGQLRPSFIAGGVRYGGWTRGKTMYCSDCHAQTGAASLGPHGSAVKWILKGPNQAWPYGTAAANGSNALTGFRQSAANAGTDGSGVAYDGWDTNKDTSNGLFCRNCHDIDSTVSGANLHARGDHNEPCVACHIRVPHGGKVSRLLSASGKDAAVTTYPGNLPLRYSANGQGLRGHQGRGTGTTAGWLTWYIKRGDISWVEGDCGQRSCGQHSASSTDVNAESW
jgi:hypothetical protein